MAVGWLSMGYFSQSGHPRITAVLYFAVLKMSLWLTCSKQETSRKEWRFHKNSTFSCITDCADAFSVQFLFGSWALTQTHPPAETKSAIHGLKIGALVLGNHLADRCFCLPVSIIVFSPTNSYPRKRVPLVQRRKGGNPQKLKHFKSLGVLISDLLAGNVGREHLHIQMWMGTWLQWVFHVSERHKLHNISQLSFHRSGSASSSETCCLTKMCRVEPWSYKDEGHLSPCRDVACVQSLKTRILMRAVVKQEVGKYWVKLRRNSSFFIPWADQFSFLPPSMSPWWIELAHRKETQSSVYFVFWNHLQTPSQSPDSSFLLEEGLDMAVTVLVESKARRQRAGSSSSLQFLTSTPPTPSCSHLLTTTPCSCGSPISVSFQSPPATPQATLAVPSLVGSLGFQGQPVDEL